MLTDVMMPEVDGTGAYLMRQRGMTQGDSRRHDERGRIAEAS
jgi:hypothetical protein